MLSILALHVTSSFVRCFWCGFPCIQHNIFISVLQIIAFPPSFKTIFSISCLFSYSLTLNKLRQKQMLEEKLEKRRKMRMEKLQHKHENENKVCFMGVRVFA